MLAIYLVVLVAEVAAGAGPHRPLAAGLVLGDIGWFAIAVVLARLVAKPHRIGEGFYRLTLIALVIASYVELRWILPVVTTRTYDAELLAFDLRVFGVEPAIAWDGSVSPISTEWFAFFYYSYFFLLGSWIFPTTFLEKREDALIEFAFGIIVVFSTAHVLYTIVPAVGPHLYWPGFERELTGRVWWPRVEGMVAAAGARTDAFPSLHTAAPSFIALHAFRQRKRPGVYRWAWIPTSFVVSQIVVSTMFLRWHYLVDVVAGLLLAVSVWAVAPTVARYEISRRRRACLPPVFAPVPDWLRRGVSRGVAVTHA